MEVRGPEKPVYGVQSTEYIKLYIDSSCFCSVQRMYSVLRTRRQRKAVFGFTVAKSLAGSSVRGGEGQGGAIPVENGPIAIGK